MNITTTKNASLADTSAFENAILGFIPNPSPAMNLTGGQADALQTSGTLAIVEEKLDTVKEKLDQTSELLKHSSQPWNGLADKSYR